MTLISFRHPVAETATLADAALLRSLVWDRSAPNELTTAARRGDVVHFAQAWKAHSRERWTSATQRELLAGWSVALTTDEALAERIATLDRHATRPTARHRGAIKSPATWSVRVQPFLKALTAGGSSDLQTPFGLLCGLELLTPATIGLPHKLWWPLWRDVLSSAFGVAGMVEGRGLRVEGQKKQDVVSDSQPSTLNSQPDWVLLAHGELPFLTGLIFADLAGAARLVDRSRRVLKKELVARADTDGTPHSELLPRLPLWLAPLVRSTVWAKRFGVELWSDEERRLLSDVAERAVALCRGDGRSALTNGLPMPALPVLTKAAEVFDWSRANPSLGSLRQLQRQVREPKSRLTARRGAVQVMPSAQSDWARMVLLRSDWSPAADSVTIAHHERLPQVDITAAGRQVLHGAWGLQVQIDDAPVELAEEWSCVCWESDPDGDYAELQMLGPKRMRVERVVFLSRKDRFLLMADSISNAPAGRITLTSQLPLARDIVAEADSDTRALRLEGPRFRARAFPLALPTTWVYSTPHRFQAVDGRLELQQVVAGRGAFAPLVFDWDPQRWKKDAEWRTLTVSENTRRATPDAAAGHRLRVGATQWLFYRSLKKTPHARAVLGHHTFHETVIARFDKNGDADPLLMIEG